MGNFGYEPFADDYYINLHLNTEMELPDNRETVLHFCEQMKKRFPDLTKFSVRDNGDMVLEGDKEQESYRWVAIEQLRLCSGHVNPGSPEDAYDQHEIVLDLAPHLLSISLLDCEALDLMYGFDFTFEGNHDEVVSEALGMPNALERLIDDARIHLINYEPTVTFALDDARKLQCRFSIETRSNPNPSRTSTQPDDQLSVYFTVRRYWGQGNETSFLHAFHELRRHGEDLLAERIVPKIIRPLAQVIRSK